MDQNPSRKANSRSATQIPYPLWIPKVHYRVYMNLPLFVILNQIN